MHKRAWLMIAGITTATMALVVYGCSSDMPNQLGGQPGGPVVQGGPCSPEGAVSACHQVISQHDGVIDCFNSTATCTNGVWGACGASSATISTHAFRGGPVSGAISIQSLSDASTTGPPCSTDPCNPYCSGYSETPPIAVAPPACASDAGVDANPQCTSATVTGIIKDPAGNQPVYGATVFVPSNPTMPAPAFTAGTGCDTCASITKGLPAYNNALVHTDVAGNFTLNGVPAGSPFTLVVQTGRWRRQVQIPAIAGCGTFALPAAKAHLPKVHVRTVMGSDEASDLADPDIPQMAIATGNADATECLLKKMGVATSEFTLPPSTFPGGGRVHMYHYNGATNLAAGSLPDYSTLVTAATLPNYNVLVLPCNNCGDNITGCSPTYSSAMSGIVKTWADGGGRVFASHWSINDLVRRAPAPYPTVASWGYNSTPTTATVDTSFPDGVALSTWMTNSGNAPPIALVNGRDGITGYNSATSKRWIWDSANTQDVSILSFDTPVNVPSNMQCGRFVVPEMHVSQVSSGTFPGECNGNALSAQELAFEFMLFETSACLTPITTPAPPPAVPPLNYGQTYTASCPAGTKAEWGLLAYNVSAVAPSDVKFAVQAGPLPDGGGAPSGPWTPATPVVVADTPVDHPNLCAMTGPGPLCPVDLFTPLGGKPNANQESVNLSVTLTPAGCNAAGFKTTANGTNSACSGGADLNIGACTTNANCQQDFHCVAGSCLWSSASGYFDPNCKDGMGNPGVDLTIGVPCGNGAGYILPICNRGGGTLAGGTVVTLENSGNGGSGAWDCSVTNPPTVSGGSVNCTFVAPMLGPGQCTFLDTTTLAGAACGNNLLTGQRDIYINWDRSVAECGTGFTGTGAGCMNNSAHTKSTGNSCPPACMAPPQPPPPALNSWQVSYSCVPSE